MESHESSITTFNLSASRNSCLIQLGKKSIHWNQSPIPFWYIQSKQGREDHTGYMYSTKKFILAKVLKMKVPSVSQRSQAMQGA